MPFYEFWNQHLFLAWCALWLGWGAVAVVGILLELVAKMMRRLARTLMVVFRGWPPAHLDADGDFRPEPKPAAAGGATAHK